MKISTAGFTDFDAQLLGRQLNIVAVHSSADWEYVGEQAPDADLLLVRSINEQTCRLVEGFDGIVAASSDCQAGLPGSVLPLEWPVRVFTLLALLDAAATRSASKAPSSPCCEQLARLQGDAWLEINGWPLLIRGREGLLIGMGGSFEQALQAFKGDGASLVSRLQQDQLPDGPVVWRSSLQRLIWSLALHEGQDATRNWPAARAWHINSYPHFEEWECSPQFLRLAALFTRGHETLAAAAEKSRVDAGQIRAFLYACQQCQLGLDSQIVPPQAAPQRPTLSDGLIGMLGQLRSRLGLGLR